MAANSGETFDYVIVAAGSAGCILANRLSADGTHTVCLLEAGPPDWNPFIHIPAGFMKTLVNPNINWLYEGEPSYWTGGRMIAHARGKTLGGSGSINGHVYSRGQRLDFDGRERAVQNSSPIYGGAVDLLRPRSQSHWNEDRQCTNNESGH